MAFNIDVTAHIHLYSHDPAQLDRVEKLVSNLVHQGVRIMSALDGLTADVAANHDVVSSAVALLNGIAARLAAAGTDPVALAKLHTDLTTDTSALAAAVAANTPAADSVG